MIDRKQADLIFEKLREYRSTNTLKKISDIDSGMKFILLYLSDKNEEIYASTISEKFNISRARVAVILKKMEDKNLIKKNISIKDARIEFITITKDGLKVCQEHKEKVINNIIKVIDKIGFDKFNEFIDTAKIIREIIN